MPKISGYNGCQGFNCYDDQLAISQNQLSQNINDVQSQCVPASLNGLSVVNPKAPNAYLYVDDGSKKKVALSDVLNANLDGTFKSLEGNLKSKIKDLDSKLDAVDKRLDVHGERLNRERELEWKQLLAIKNIEANMVNLNDNVAGIDNIAREAIETAAKAVEKYNNYKEDLTRILERLDIHNDRLDRERIWEWQQLIALRRELAKKQDRLIAGKGIKLEGNVIWCEYEGGEGGGLTEEEVKKLLKNYPTNEELETALDAIRADILKLANDIAKIKPVNADWNETDSSKLSYIKNKPELDNFATKSDVEDVKKLIPKIDRLATKAALAEEVQKLDEAKQDKLVAGDNVVIENNVISVTVPDVDTSKLATKEELEEVKDLIPAVDNLATKAELTAGLNKKQDKLTAGENITIKNGVISAIDTICKCTECKIGVDFITNVTVGNLQAGTEISADTTLADLLKMMLMKPESDKVKLYIGTSDSDDPDSLTGLSAFELSEEALLADNGADILMPAVNNAHWVIACPNDYELRSWIDITTNFALSYVSKVVPGYHLYYINEPDWDYDDDGKITQSATTYRFKFDLAVM